MAPNGTSRERSRSRGRGESKGKDASPSPIVPIIDIGPLRSGDSAARLACARKIGKACEDIGFFVVTNHGIPQELIEGTCEKTLEFFDLPLKEKLSHKTDDEAQYPYGYSALGGEVLSRGKSLESLDDSKAAPALAAGDMKEMMSIGPKDPASGMASRRMPSKPEGFTEAWETYYSSCNELARTLLRAFSLALDLKDDFFEAKMDHHISALRANNYPTQTGMTVPAGSIRCSAHTDYGTLTILKSGGPGLQVAKDKGNPVWHDVPFVKDGFVINLGDLMRRWTNDKWSSTLHRVINPPADKTDAWGRRLALAFFHNLNKDAVVEAIPSCVTPERPALYDPIVAGEFLMLKHLASNGKADPDAHLQQRSKTSGAAKPYDKSAYPWSSVFQGYECDNLYHLGLDTSHNLQKLFGDTEVVCVMGSTHRAVAFAEMVSKEVFNGKIPVEHMGTDERCKFLKVGKVLSLSHGMGSPSLFIFMHELAKLLFHANCDLGKVRIIRLGTCGGLGCPGGTVLLTDQALDGELEFGYRHVSLGKVTRWPAKADAALNADLQAVAKEAFPDMPVKIGNTVATDDYYEGQGRRDGAIMPGYSEEEQLKWLRHAHLDKGVMNMEMEGTAMLHFWGRLGVSATQMCAVLLDRLHGDQHNDGKVALKEYMGRPLQVMVAYLKKHVGGSA